MKVMCAAKAAKAIDVYMRLKYYTLVERKYLDLREQV